MKLIDHLCGRRAFVATLAILVTLLPVALADSGPAHQATQARPIQLGTSGGNVNDISSLYCCSGTLGSLVQDSAGVQYILSNNHVLGRANQGAAGEPVNQPGAVDQNCAELGIVANLSAYVPLKFKVKGVVPLNDVDAAMAQVIPSMVRTDGAILDVGPVSSNTVAAFVGQTVQKSGRTTGLTQGAVAATDVTVDVGYSQTCGGASTKVARFVNQIRITPGSFSAGGDSGSLVLESGSADPGSGLPRATGLLFAGSSSSTIVNPIARVLAQLGVTMVGGTPPPPAPTGAVAGIVTNATDATPIGGATVSADSGQSTTTGPDGAYILPGVATGTRAVTATAVGFAPQINSVTVSDGLTATSDFALSPVTVATQSIAQCITYTTSGGKGGSKNLIIGISVVDDLGAPVANAVVNIAVTRNGSPYANGSGATTNSQGKASYTAQNASNGVYVTTVTAINASGLTFEGSTPANSFAKGTDATPVSFCRSGAQSAASAQSGKAYAHAKDVKGRNSARLFAAPGVVGHGLGLSSTGKPVIEVYLEKGDAATRAKIPAKVEDVPVQIVVTGPFSAI